MTPQHVVLVNGRLVAIATVTPGRRVVLQSAQGVVDRAGRCVVMAQPVADPYDADAVVVTFPSAMPDTVYGAASPSVIPAPISRRSDFASASGKRPDPLNDRRVSIGFALQA